MSTTPYPGPYPTTIAQILVHHITTTPAAVRRPRSSSHLVRRLPTGQQGRALEKLGHAIEYLVDSDLYLKPSNGERASTTSRDRAETAQTLMRLSREVFAECRLSAPARSHVTLQRLMRLLAPSPDDKDHSTA